MEDSSEITLKDILIVIKELVSYLIGKWLLILVGGFLGGIIGITYAYYQPTKYLASLTFSLEDDKGVGSISGAMGLASSLGFGLDAGGSISIFSGANLIQLLKSRTMIENALLSPMFVDSINVSLADYYIKKNKLDLSWNSDPILREIHFIPGEDRSHYSRQKDSILGQLYRAIAGSDGPLVVSQKDKLGSILTISVKTTDEHFAKYFAESLASVVSAFYIETKSKKAKINVDILQRQTDSVNNELNAAISGVAAASNATYNLNPALFSQKTPGLRRQVDVQANTAILSQLLSNLEIAKMTLLKETPLIQVIDRPIFPLQKEKLGRFKAMIIGGLIGGFLLVIGLIAQRKVSSLLKD